MEVPHDGEDVKDEGEEKEDHPDGIEALHQRHDDQLQLKGGEGENGKAKEGRKEGEGRKKGN